MIRRDLFSDDDNGYMQDAGLLERLALAKLNKTVDKVKAEGFAWVDSHPGYFGYSELSDFGRAGTVTRHATEAEQKEIDALEAELAALQKEEEPLGEDEEDGKMGCASGSGQHSTRKAGRIAGKPGISRS